MHLMIPVPGLRVDRLSYTAKDLQGRFVILCHMLISCTYEGSDQSRSCVELLDLQVSQDSASADSN